MKLLSRFLPLAAARRVLPLLHLKKFRDPRSSREEHSQVYQVIAHHARTLYDVDRESRTALYQREWATIHFQ